MLLQTSGCRYALSVVIAARAEPNPAKTDREP
jgi:hypothetical protein